MPRTQTIGNSIRHSAQLTYLTGANNYTWLQYKNGERVLLSKSLTYFADQLPEFVRIHKTALVNPSYVAELQAPPRPKMAGAVRMQDGTVLPVGRRRWQQVAKVLQKREPAGAPTVAQPVSKQAADPDPSLTRTIVAVSTGDTLQLLRQSLTSFEPQYALQEMISGAALPEWLLLNPTSTWPALIILDARTNPIDRFIALQTLKRHERLRAIPVIWLVAPGHETRRAYALNANSVVVVRHEPAQFVAAIERLCRYWLAVVRLPTPV